MKRTVLLLASAASLWGVHAWGEENTWSKGSGHYSYEASDFIEFSYSAEEDSLNAYTLSPGSAPDGYSYVEEKTTASAGALNVSNASDDSKAATGNSGVRKLGLSGAASATAWIAANEVPYSFTLSMSGELAKPGEEEATVTWDAKAKSDFFWLEPFTQIVKAGNAVTVSAKGDDSTSTWSISSSGGINYPNGKFEIAGKEKEQTSLTLNQYLWDCYGIKLPQGQVPPLAGKYTLTASSVVTKRSASADIHVVEITKPAKPGNPDKWLSESMQYDCQTRVTSTLAQDNHVDIQGNWAGANNGEWNVEKGSIQNQKSSNTGFWHTKPDKGISLELCFPWYSTDAIDTRTIDVFLDYLELGIANFGSSRSCRKGWKPVAKYGISESDLPEINETWNCHGSVLYFDSGSTVGYSEETVNRAGVYIDVNSAIELTSCVIYSWCVAWRCYCILWKSGRQRNVQIIAFMYND
ncbi:MAG: hypothetical protein HP043_03310 [Dialister sp.]|nr:hypothetical protein [Dialister sp.]